MFVTILKFIHKVKKKRRTVCVCVYACVCARACVCVCVCAFTRSLLKFARWLVLFYKSVKSIKFNLLKQCSILL